MAGKSFVPLMLLACSLYVLLSTCLLDVSAASVNAYTSSDPTCSSTIVGSASGITPGSACQSAVNPGTPPSNYTLACTTSTINGTSTTIATLNYYSSTTCSTQLQTGSGLGDGNHCFAIYFTGTNTPYIYTKINCNAAHSITTTSMTIVTLILLISMVLITHA